MKPRQTYDQANSGRVSPLYAVQFACDLTEAARNGSPQARRRARVLGWFSIVLFVVVPLTLFLLAEFFGWGPGYATSI